MQQMLMCANFSWWLGSLRFICQCNINSSYLTVPNIQITRIKNRIRAFRKVQKHRCVRLDAVKPLYTAWKCWDVAETDANDQ